MRVLQFGEKEEKVDGSENKKRLRMQKMILFMMVRETNKKDEEHIK